VKENGTGTHTPAVAIGTAVLVADTGATLGHAELENTSARVATALRSRGLDPGATIAVLSEHRLEAFQVRRAARRSGLFIAELDPSLSLQELAYVLNDSHAEALFVSEQYVEVADSLRALTPYVGLRVGFGGSVSGLESYDELLADSGAPVPLSRGDRWLFYTAGTTGRPRAVRRSGWVGRSVPLDDETVLFAPATHADPVAAQLVEQVLDAGGTVVTLARFDARTAARAIHEHSPTLLHLLPAQLVPLSKLPSVDLPESRATLVHSSAPCPPAVKRWALDWLGDRVTELYGGAVCDELTSSRGVDWRARPGTVGRATKGRLHICDDAGEVLPAGKVGLVYFDPSPPYRQAAADVTGLTRSHPGHPGWFTLGDLGRLDDDGYLYLVDRDVFALSNGNGRVFPREVEDLLVVHPKVADAVVLATHDDHLGPLLRAVVQPAVGVSPGVALERELRAYLRSRLPVERLPGVVDFAASLPRTASGKLLKRKLAPRFALSDTVA